MNAAYLENWLRVLRSDKTAIFSLASDARRACDWLIAASEAGAEPLITTCKGQRTATRTGIADGRIDCVRQIYGRVWANWMARYGDDGDDRQRKKWALCPVVATCQQNCYMMNGTS